MKQLFHGTGYAPVLRHESKGKRLLQLDLVGKGIIYLWTSLLEIVLIFTLKHRAGAFV